MKAAPIVTPAIDEPLYTVKEVSSRWRCNPETVRRQIRRGQLKAMFKCGKHLVPESEVKAAEKQAMTPGDSRPRLPEAPSS